MSLCFVSKALVLSYVSSSNMDCLLCLVVLSSTQTERELLESVLKSVMKRSYFAQHLVTIAVDALMGDHSSHPWILHHCSKSCRATNYVFNITWCLPMGATHMEFATSSEFINSGRGKVCWPIRRRPIPLLHI